MDTPYSSSRRSPVTPENVTRIASNGVSRPLFEAASSRQSISLRAVFAGLTISFLVYLGLLALGLGIGGSSLEGLIRQGQNIGGLGLGSAIWMIVAIFFSLFVGSYFAGRVSGMVPSRFGGVQGLVISALFFGIILSSVGSSIGLLGQGISSTVNATGSAIGNLSQNPQVSATVENVLGNLDLRSPPNVVVQGITARLMQGDTTGARDYLAYQTGLSPAEAQARIDTIHSNFENTLRSVGSGIARAASVAGWTLCVSILIGSLAAVWGGTSGVRRNLLHPLSDRDIDLRQRSSVA